MHPPMAKIEMKRFGKGDDIGLRRPVVPVAGTANAPGYGGHVEDATPAPGGHGRGEGVAELGDGQHHQL